MKKELILATAMVILMVTGCAQKKLITEDPNINGVNGEVIDSNSYTNVDPFGSDNSSYRNYTDDSAYANGGLGGVQNIYFDVDKYAITPDMLPTIINNANLLRGKKIKIEGHCDASGTDEYNFALGLRRAKAAKDAIVAHGINPSNVTIVSLGESAPECITDHSSSCYAKNRRVEFKAIQ